MLLNKLPVIENLGLYWGSLRENEFLIPPKLKFCEDLRVPPLIMPTKESLCCAFVGWCGLAPRACVIFLRKLVLFRLASRPLTD